MITAMKSPDHKGVKPMLKVAALLLFSLFLFTGWPSQSSAQTSDLSAVPASFVDIGFGSRPAGMGSAFVGLADDANSVYWNPAGLATLQGYQVHAMHTKQFGLIHYSYLTGAAQLGNNRGVGISLISSGDDLMREFSFHGAYSQKVGPVRVGAALKYRYAGFGNNVFNEDDYYVFEPDEIDEGKLNQVSGSAHGVGFDIGALYQPLDIVTLGVMLRDIYSPIFWNSEIGNPDKSAKGSYSETTPFEVIVGAAVRAHENMLVTTDFMPSYDDDTDHVLRIGGELTLWKMVFLRAGTQQRINSYNDDTYTLGTGIQVMDQKKRSVSLNYTYWIEDIHNTHRFGLALSF